MQDSTQKDFLAWWQQDLAPTILAARKALEPYIKKFNEFSIALDKAFKQFIIEHEETINSWVEFAKIYPTLEPYVNNILKGLHDPDFEIANDVLGMSDIFDAIDLEQDPEAVTLMSLISGENFQKSLSDIFSNLPLNQERLSLIQEALLLHNNTHYGGSICLLYGLIEGILTESFEKANYIVISSKKINPVSPDGYVNKKKNLTGLVPKLDHAIQHQDELSLYYKKIKGYELVAGDADQTIPKTRNTILHGGSVDFNTEKRSAQLILWLYSALLNIQELKFNK